MPYVKKLGELDHCIHMVFGFTLVCLYDQY